MAQRQIARSCSIGQSTVSEYLKAAEAAQLYWPEVAGWEEVRLTAVQLVKGPAEPKPSRQVEPDFAAIHTELQQHKHLVLPRYFPWVAAGPNKVQWVKPVVLTQRRRA